MDYNARYYSTRLGRFVSPDTVVPEPGSSSGFNRYRYARNNPLMYTDPSGHAECWDADCEYLRNPKTGEFISEDKNLELVKSVTWPLPRSTEFIGEQPDPLAPGVANTLHTIGEMADWVAFEISGASFLGELMAGGAAALGVPTFGDEPATFTGGFLFGVAAYQPANMVGDVIGGIGAGASFFGDIAASEFYIHKDDGFGLVVPSSTQIELATAYAGYVLPEAGLDAAVDLQLIDQLANLNIAGLELNAHLESYLPTRMIGVHSQKPNNQ